MKIAMIIDHLLSGGKERRMVELIKVLSKNSKYKFHIIILEGKDETAIDYKDILDCPVKITYLGKYSRFSLPIQLYKICKIERFDLIHLWAALIYGYFLLPVHYLLHVPIISSSITSARKQGGNKFWLHRFTYFFYDKILSNSCQALIVNQVPKAKAVCIYNGFNPERLKIKVSPEQIRERFNIKSTFIVSMAGEYSERKDYPMFVKAANRVLEKKLDVTFIAMGSGDSLPYKVLVKPEYSQNILFVGRVTDVESVFNASDVVVLATTVEGVSNTIMEGMSMAKPIVSTYGPNVGTEEIVENGKSGYLVSYHDDKSFADCIVKLLLDANLREEMGNRGKEIVKAKFSIDQMVNGFAKVYNDYC